MALARLLYAAWERGDFSPTGWAHPEIEFVIADGPSPGRWMGPAGMAEGFADFASAWDEYRVEAEEYRELDAERVLVLVRNGGRGKTSGLDLDQLATKSAALIQFRDRQVIRYVLYWDRKHAFADLDLATESDSPRA